jgi:hypothetical protein
MEPTEEGENTVAGRDTSMDPAYRMFLIDCISQGWSAVLASELQSEEVVQSLRSLISVLLQWTEDCLSEEVWSVRKSSILLVGNMASRSTLTSEQSASAMSIMRRAFQEPKFVKVKLAVLEALGMVMNGVNRASLKLHHNEDISYIIRQATTDTQPSILEAAAKLQLLLLNF